MAKKQNTKVSIDRICKTCALYDPTSGYDMRKNEQTPGIRYACEDFRTPEEWMKEMSNWIKVSDRLPEEREQVLIRYWNGQIHTGARFGNKWHSNWNDYDIDLATHWMLLENIEE